ncbi:HVO_0758 family zinc finger protein [Halovivax limisalsi]|uniref:HVO_0758 family zinc finger protein n=1 Tax=Halovivax limisalsi TaxID=1453760 RepID=UPI001FFCA0BF|nr:HVO_0758 family zinc finger protein [Halovivax limisalsi]
MKSIRKALREGELVKDTYERVTCAECEKALKTENDPDTITTIRRCPDCGTEWKEIR